MCLKEKTCWMSNAGNMRRSSLFFNFIIYSITTPPLKNNTVENMLRNL